MIYGGGAVVRYENRSNSTEVFVHVDMCCNPGFCLLVDKGFNKSVLTISQNSNKEKSFCYFTGIGVYDMCRITCPIYFNLFPRLTWDMHCSTSLFFIHLDVIAELGIHKWLIAIHSAFLTVFHPKELFVYSVTEQFLSDVIIIRQPFICCRFSLREK